MSPDRGAMAMAMAGVVAIVGVLSVAVAALGMLYGAKTQATTAADAAALAAAVASYPPASGRHPAVAAAEIADANGATVVACICSRDTSLEARTVEVMTVVVVDVPVFGTVTVKGVSRAEFDPLRWLGG